MLRVVWHGLMSLTSQLPLIRVSRPGNSWSVVSCVYLLGAAAEASLRSWIFFPTACPQAYRRPTYVRTVCSARQPNPTEPTPS